MAAGEQLTRMASASCVRSSALRLRRSQYPKVVPKVFPKVLPCSFMVGRCVVALVGPSYRRVLHLSPFLYPILSLFG